MSLGSQIAANLPYLRRYARALTGSQAAGDALVRAMLEAVVADAALMASLDGGRVPLYRAITKVWASAQLADAPVAGASTSEHEAGAQLRLGAITPPARQALLLTTLEDFTTAEAAGILELDNAAVAALVAEIEPVLGLREAPRVLSITRWPRAVAQPGRDHPRPEMLGQVASPLARNGSPPLLYFIT